VFDLNENKYEPVCEQLIIKKGKLTHLIFNPTEPILLAGDDKGSVYSLKLSPNLRKKKRASDDTPENERLERIISIVLGGTKTQ
jgi:dynein intermediate chain 1